MYLSDIDAYFRKNLGIEELKKVDSALNGVQVAGSGRDISRMAFAVDACIESFKRAKELNAGLLFVHHGLFWGALEPVKDVLYTRLKFLIENDIVLYSVHLPLDKHPEFGNNAGIAAALNLSDIEEFGYYKGVRIGFKGKLPAGKTTFEIADILGIDRNSCPGILSFGPEKNKGVGIISGGCPGDVRQAIDEDLDLYITGEMSHQIYHLCQENRINMIAGGHYNTEKWGVRLLAEKVKNDTGIDTVFIDVPTGF